MAQYVGIAFEAIDEELAKAYSKKDYRVERSDYRTIQGIFGAVTIRCRRMYRMEKACIRLIGNSVSCHTNAIRHIFSIVWRKSRPKAKKDRVRFQIAEGVKVNEKRRRTHG